MSQLSYWQVKWVVPAALVKAAIEIGEGDVEKGLRLIAERGESWMRSLALELIYSRSELKRILEDLNDGLRVDPSLVELIKKSIKVNVIS